MAKTPAEIIKDAYFFYEEDKPYADVELSGSQIQILMQRYADQQTSQLREELEAAKKRVQNLLGDVDVWSKEIERIKLILKNCVSCGYYSNWETFKSEHNL